MPPQQGFVSVCYMKQLKIKSEYKVTGYIGYKKQKIESWIMETIWQFTSDFEWTTQWSSLWIIEFLNPSGH